MTQLRCFIDRHDRAHGSFPAAFGQADLSTFYPLYAAACAAEGVIPLRLHLGLAEGRAFCLTLAPDADSVARAHARLGLPMEDITEVTGVSPWDIPGLAA